MTQKNAEKRRARALQEETRASYQTLVNLIRQGLDDEAIRARLAPKTRLP